MLIRYRRPNQPVHLLYRLDSCLDDAHPTFTIPLTAASPCSPIVYNTVVLAGLLKRDHAKKGVSLATTDVTIAAVAIHNQLTLLTDNTRHYPMKELSLYPLARVP